MMLYNEVVPDFYKFICWYVVIHPRWTVLVRVPAPSSPPLQPVSPLQGPLPTDYHQSTAVRQSCLSKTDCSVKVFHNLISLSFFICLPPPPPPPSTLPFLYQPGKVMLSSLKCIKLWCVMKVILSPENESHDGSLSGLTSDTLCAHIEVID